MTQREFIGQRSVARVADVIAERGARRVLLVTGKGSYAASGAEAALAPSLGDVETRRFHDFDVNPRLDQALVGVELVRDWSPELVVAIGGGSVLDMGKLVTFLAAQPGDAETLIRKGGAKDVEAVPMVAVPTTAGTGSEATHFAVVYVDGEKFSLAHPTILPTVAVVDPDLLHDMPAALAACSSLDALAQATESFWSVGATEESQGYAEEALRLLLPNIAEVVDAPSAAVLAAMARGSNLAGKAINISKTTAPHAFSYPITSNHGVPHGHAVALTLGRFFEYNSAVDEAEINDPRGAEYVRETFERLFALYGCANARECAEKWREIVRSLGLTTDPTEVGIESTVDRWRITGNVNLERLNNNPVKLTATHIAELFDQ